MTINGVRDSRIRATSIAANAVIEELHSTGEMSYSDAQSMCTNIQATLCTEAPITQHLNFQPRDNGIDSWTPISGNQWLQIGNRPHKYAILRHAPSWGSSKSFQDFKRRVYCCPKTASRHFTIEEDAQLILSNIVLKGGNAGSGKDGGAIRIQGAGTLIAFHATFYSNYAGLRGGAIFGSSGSNIMLYKSDILYNQATTGGGATVEEAESILVFDGGKIVEIQLLGRTWIKAGVEFLALGQHAILLAQQSKTMSQTSALEFIKIKGR